MIPETWNGFSGMIVLKLRIDAVIPEKAQRGRGSPRPR